MKPLKSNDDRSTEDPTQINTWKKEFLQHSSLFFEKEGTGSNADEKDQLIQSLYDQLGEQKVVIDFLKKLL